jgi:hypothetical protein
MPPLPPRDREELSFVATPSHRSFSLIPYKSFTQAAPAKMMMSKPAPTKSEEPAAAKKPAAAASAKKKSPQDAVADLERRLAELTTHMPAAALSASAAKGETPAAAAPASALDPPASETAVAAPAAATAPSRGGKNALLVSLFEDLGGMTGMR